MHQQWHHQEHQLTATNNQQRPQQPARFGYSFLPTNHIHHTTMDTGQMINPNFSYPFDSDYHSWREVPAFCEDWMTGSGRKRISKWDLKEAPHLFPGEHNDAGPGRTSNNEPQTRWHYGEGNYKEGRESLDASDFWDGDTTYGTKMSPGLDEWRQQKRNRSPESSRGRSYRSRSRSRSPERGFKRASSNDSIGVQPCKDFVAGRCRRGDLCPHIHQDYKYSEDRKYLGSGLTDSWEGRHRRIDASKYFTSDDTRERTPRTGRSNDFSRRSTNEVSRERESDRRDRVTSFEHNRTHESRRSGDIVCKFFAAGNCRNGKFCRFSHHGQTRDSFDNKPRSDWRQGVNSLDRMDSLKEGSRWSGTAVSDVASFSKWNEDRSGGLGIPEQRSISRSVDDSLATDNRFMVHHMDNDKAIENSERDYLQLTADNTGSGIGVSESRDTDIRVADMEISPAWDYRLPSSNHIVKEESRHTTEPSKFSLQDEVALQTFQQDIIHDVNQKHQTVAVMQPLILQTSYFQQNPSLDNDALNRFSCENRNTIRDGALPHIDLNFSAYVPPREGLDQNGQGSTTVTHPHSCLNVIDKNKQIFAPYTPKDESFTYIGNPQPPQEGTPSKPDVLDTIKSDVISDNPSTQSIVSSEQFSNLTVSLARLLESGKQLPELYAALNGSNSMGFTQSSLSNSAGPAAFPAPVSSQPKSAVGSQKQCDPVSGSMELTTVSLARLLESGKQLPELYAALNGSNSMGFTQSSLSNSAGPAAFPAPVSSQPKSAVGSQKQYEPVSGSMELTTVSLARLLESGKQLPELYAALNGSNSMGFTQSSLSNSAGPAAFPAPVSSQPKSAVGYQKQYDPVSGSMELTTVSLARFLESGKQLPELYAALNGSNSMGFTQSSLSNSAGPAAFPAPVSSQPKSAVGSQKQYDPVSGSMELTKSEISNLPGEVVPNSSENKRFLGEKPEIQAQLPPFFPGGPSGVDLYRTDSINADLNTNIHQLSREDQNGNNKGMENNTMKVEERNKGQHNGVMGKIEGDGRGDESKKNNDGKGIRAFKFALAEFVKELLKPTWKEGQINKEAHKTIVKKVVDKVTGTIQGGHIPQSQEKIDSYLSSSKPKLSKLVQAYVEKIQKEKPAVT